MRVIEDLGTIETHYLLIEWDGEKIEYRCGPEGKSWERRYGESWESEYSNEEKLKAAFEEFYRPAFKQKLWPRDFVHEYTIKDTRFQPGWYYENELGNWIGPFSNRDEAEIALCLYASKLKHTGKR